MRCSQALHQGLEAWLRHAALPSRCLDLAAGSGEATLALEAWLQRLSAPALVEAADPYTYEAKTYKTCLKLYNFI